MEISAPEEMPVSASEIVDKIQVAVEDTLESGKPIELDPARGKLFELFAGAFAAGLTVENGPLGADELTRELGKRWGLDQSAQQSVASQQKLNDQDLAKMRALWSTLRLWMEWDYAWTRWAEFNGSVKAGTPR